MLYSDLYFAVGNKRFPLWLHAAFTNIENYSTIGHDTQFDVPSYCLVG